MSDDDLTAALIAVAAAAAGASGGGGGGGTNSSGTATTGRRKRQKVEAREAERALQAGVQARLAQGAAGAAGLQAWVQARLLAIAEWLLEHHDGDDDGDGVKDLQQTLAQRKLDAAYRFLLSVSAAALPLMAPEAAQLSVRRLLEAEEAYEAAAPPWPFAWLLLGAAEAAPRVVVPALLRAAAAGVAPAAAQALLPALDPAQVAAAAADAEPALRDPLARLAAKHPAVLLRALPPLLARLPSAAMAAGEAWLAPLLPLATPHTLFRVQDPAALARRLAPHTPLLSAVLAAVRGDEALAYAWATALLPELGALPAAAEWAELAFEVAGGVWAAPAARALIDAGRPAPVLRRAAPPDFASAADLARALDTLLAVPLGAPLPLLLELAAGQEGGEAALKALALLWACPPDLSAPAAQHALLRALLGVVVGSASTEETVEAVEAATRVLEATCAPDEPGGDDAFGELVVLALDECFRGGGGAKLQAHPRSGAVPRPVVAFNALGPTADPLPAPSPTGPAGGLLAQLVPALSPPPAPAPAPAPQKKEEDPAALADLVRRVVRPAVAERAPLVAQALARRVTPPAARRGALRQRPELHVEVERMFAQVPALRALVVDVCVGEWPEHSRPLWPVARALLGNAAFRGLASRDAQRLLAVLADAGWLPREMRDSAGLLPLVPRVGAGALLRAAWQAAIGPADALAPAEAKLLRAVAVANPEVFAGVWGRVWGGLLSQ